MTRRLVTWASRAFGAAAIAAAIAIVLLAIAPLVASHDPSAPAFLGRYAPIVVLGGSMEPTYHVGSILFIERVEPAQVAEGDIITFETPQSAGVLEGTLTTHRVVAVEAGAAGPAFRTQGDANNAEDTWVVPAATVVGRGRFAVPYVGYASSFIRSKTGFVLLVVIPALLIVILEITSLVKSFRARRAAAPTAGETT